MPTHSHIPWEPRAISLGVKKLWLKAGHSATFSAEVKAAYSYTATTSHDMTLNKSKEQKYIKTAKTLSFIMKVLNWTKNFSGNLFASLSVDW
jgi:hypothetical protein